MRTRLRGSVAAVRSTARKRARRSVVAEPGEELVELVHDEQELGVRAGEEVRGGTQEPVVVALDPLGEAGRRRGRREPHERRRQLTERVLAGRHLGDEDPG